MNDSPAAPPDRTPDTDDAPGTALVRKESTILNVQRRIDATARASQRAVAASLGIAPALTIMSVFLSLLQGLGVIVNASVTLLLLVGAAVFGAAFGVWLRDRGAAYPPWADRALRRLDLDYHDQLNAIAQSGLSEQEQAARRQRALDDYMNKRAQIALRVESEEKGAS